MVDGWLCLVVVSCFVVSFLFAFGGSSALFWLTSAICLLVGDDNTQVGESIEAAAVREVKEETNLDLVHWEQFRVYSDPKRYVEEGRGRVTGWMR